MNCCCEVGYKVKREEGAGESGTKETSKILSTDLEWWQMVGTLHAEIGNGIGHIEVAINFILSLSNLTAIPKTLEGN